MATQPAYADLSNPILITLDAQDIGRLYANRTSPHMFRQYIIELLRQAGAPVEGILELKFKYGELAKFRKESQPGRFTYAWVPPEWCERLKEQQKFEGRLTV